MEVLQHAVQPFSPISATASRLIPPSSSARSFTPTLSSSLPAPPQTAPLHARPFAKLSAEARHAASVSPRRSPRSLVFIRNTAAAGYAAALAEAGRSNRILDRIRADLMKLACILQYKPLCRLLLNPSVQDVHKLKIFARLGEEADFLPHTLKIVNLIINKKQTALLKDVVKEFEAMYRTIASARDFCILAVTELDQAQLMSIAKQIPNMPMDLLSETGKPSLCLMGHTINYGKHTPTTAIV